MALSQFTEITEKFGFHYGPAFSVIKRVWRHDNQGLCFIDISSDKELVQEINNYVVHPAILDACLQSCFIPLGNTDAADKSIVPVGFKSVSLLRRPRCTQYFCHVTAKADTFGVFDVVLMSSRGQILLAMNEFKVAELTGSAHSSRFEDVAYEVDWIEAPIEASGDEQPLLCLILEDSSGFASALVKQLESSTTRLISIKLPVPGKFDEKAQESVKSAIDNLLVDSAETTSLQVINLWPLDTNVLPQEFDVIDSAQALSFHSSVFLFQLLSKANLPRARLVLVTRVTQFVGSATEPASMPWSASVWGFRRTAELEELNPHVMAVDLSADDGLRESELLRDEILCRSSDENEVAYRNGKRFVNRLKRMETGEKVTDKVQQPLAEDRWPFSLTLHPKTKSFCLRKQTACTLSDKEVEVEVLVAWNMSESLHDMINGSDCTFFSGRVMKLPDVSEHQVRIGEEICGVVSSSRFGKRLTVSERQILPRPTTMVTDTQAATLPACLAIAYHAIARLTTGHQEQKVLIHEANKGPGLAAVLVTTALGHKVICTSSAEDFISSNQLLLGMGAEQVLDANCLDLTEELCGLIDAAVFFYHPLPNTVHKSSRVLRQGGKLMFLNASKGGDVVLRADKFVSYERIDIVSVFMMPGKFQELFSFCLNLLEGTEMLESLLQLDQRSTDVFNAMHSSNHCVTTRNHSCDESQAPSAASLTSFSFGTLEPITSGLEVLAPGLDEHGLKANRTYLVVGGVRGFGFEVGRWMAENGAKTIVLAARSPPSVAKKQEVAELERRTGAKVLIVQVYKISRL